MPCHDRAWSSSRATPTSPVHMVWSCWCVAVAGFSFHALRTCIYFALKGNHRKQRMVCSFHAVVVFCMPVIKSSAGTTRAAQQQQQQQKQETANEDQQQSENQNKSSTGAWAVACGQQ